MFKVFQIATLPLHLAYLLKVEVQQGFYHETKEDPIGLHPKMEHILILTCC